MHQETEQRLRRSRWRQSRGEVRLGGYNAGMYPVHHFFKNLFPEPETRNVLHLAFCGSGDWRGDCFRCRLHSDTFSLELVERGQFRFEQHGHLYDVGPGEIFLVHLKQNSAIWPITGSARKWTLSCEGGLLESLLSALRLDREDVVRPEHPEEYFRRFRECAETLERNAPGCARTLSVMAWNILLALGEEVRKNAVDPEWFRLAEYVDAHLRGPFDAADFQRHMNCSSSTLLRLFRKHFNDTPNRYFISRKMLLARRLLGNMDESVKSVAYELGYTNPLYFSSEFHRIVGCSPTEFRRR